jgi:hypothetical protein
MFVHLARQSFSPEGEAAMRSFSIGLVLALLALPTFAQSTRPNDTERWQPLFNGKNLDGWYTFLRDIGKDKDPDRVFQVEDGAIHIYKDIADGAAAPFGYFCTNDEYSNYHLRFEYKWGTKRFGSRAKSRRDAGLLFHVFGPDGARPGGVWPHCLECQVQENDTGDIYAVGTSVTSPVDPAIPDKPTFKPADQGGVPHTTPEGPKVNSRVIRTPMAETDGWNKVEVIVRGDRATFVVNGKTNNQLSSAKGPNLADAAAPWVSLTKGRIAFQAEGAEVFYRNIEFKPLKPGEQERAAAK